MYSKSNIYYIIIIIAVKENEQFLSSVSRPLSKVLHINYWSRLQSIHHLSAREYAPQYWTYTKQLELFDLNKLAQKLKSSEFLSPYVNKKTLFKIKCLF